MLLRGNARSRSTSRAQRATFPSDTSSIAESRASAIGSSDVCCGVRASVAAKLAPKVCHDVGGAVVPVVLEAFLELIHYFVRRFVLLGQLDQVIPLCRVVCAFPRLLVLGWTRWHLSTPCFFSLGWERTVLGEPASDELLRPRPGELRRQRPGLLQRLLLLLEVARQQLDDLRGSLGLGGDDQVLVDGDLVVLGLDRASRDHHVRDGVAAFLDVRLALLVDRLDHVTWGVVDVPAQGVKRLFHVAHVSTGF